MTAQLAPLDAELFAAYGVEEGDESTFRSEVEQNMERELRNAVTARVKQQVMDAVLGAYSELEIPSALIAQEVDGLRQQMFQQFGGAGQDLDLKSLLPDDESIASTYEQPEEVINWYYANQEQLGAVESKVLEDAVVDRLLEDATVTEQACSYQEAIALGQQANQ